MRNGINLIAQCLLLSSAAAFVPISSVTNARFQTGAVSSQQPIWSTSASSSVKSNQILYSRTTLRDAATNAIEGAKPERKPNAIVAIVNFFAINEAFRALFIKYAISFPASLSGCGALFATFLLAPFGNTLYRQFAPGAAVLAKWLPVFFVPSLITLPLADPIGSSTELLKVAAVIVGGFFFTLFSTAWSVLAVRKFLPSSSVEANVEVAAEAVASKAVAVSQAPAAKAFSDSTALSLTAVSAASALLAVVATKMGSPMSTAVSTVFMLSTTLSAFVFGARLPKKFTKIVHPLVTCTALTWLAMAIVSKFTGKAFRSMLVAYSAAGGAGKVLLNFLGPAVISLACQMYDRRKLMKENIGEVTAAIGVSSLGGLFGTALIVRLLAIGNPTLRLALLSRNITSPLAMAIAGILGADVSLAVSMVVVTGLIGANFGASILDAAGIKDSVARGMGIGAAAHGLGTAAFANEEDAFPFAAIAMALTASACTCLVSVPPIKSAVMKLALGM